MGDEVIYMADEDKARPKTTSQEKKPEDRPLPPEREEKREKKTEEEKTEKSSTQGVEAPQQSVETKPAGGKQKEKVEARDPKPALEKKKSKKISRMTLAEVDQKLKSVQESMGGFQSDFARHLLARKKELSTTARKP